MTLSGEALQKKAKKRELKALEMNKVNPERMASLEGLLCDVYVICRPKQSDYHNRKDLIRVFNEISKEIYGKNNDHPVVVEFGSFTMDIFSPKSDLDLSINFSADTVMAPREMKIKTLRKFAKKFYALLSKGHVSSVHPIMTANVPIIKVIDSGTGIECDLSVENRDGILKSQIVHMVSSIDERFQKLSFLMKGWAKANHINSSKDHTLNSLSIVLLVAFHLQTRDPPILPPFSLILKDGSDRATVSNVIKQYVGYGKNNTESLADLFVTLLIKLSSVEKLWSRGLCASTYQGRWISKTWNNSKAGCISVEDFTDRSQNVAKAVTKDQVKKIYSCIQKSIQFVATFMEGHLQGPRLRSYLFGRDCAAASITTVISSEYQDRRQNISKKRMRITQEEEQQGWRSWGGAAGTWTTAGPPVSTVHHRSWGGPPAPALAVNAWGVPIQAAGGGGGGWGGRATGSWGGWGGGTATPSSSSSSLLGWAAPPPPPLPPQQWNNNTSDLGAWLDNNSNPLLPSFPYHHRHHR